MQYLHCKVRTDEKSIGVEAHEKLTEGSLEVKSEELWQKIFGDQPVYALKMFLAARHRGVVIAGMPDSVLFKSGWPLVFFEYKFSRSRTAYFSYHVQAQTFGILLESMGFDADQLFFEIVVADPAKRGSSELREKVLEAVAENGLKEAELDVENAKIYVNKFRSALAQEPLSWAIEYWTSSREATYTSNPNKCAKCEYQKECRT